MVANKSAYEEALKKLNLPPEVLYDEKGKIKPQYVLTVSEKKALLFYVESDRYFKRENLEYNKRSGEEQTQYHR